MSKVNSPNEPTADQCSSNTIVFEDEKTIHYADWYPQMGGYCGKAVIVIDKDDKDGCFEAYVWHDGEFPFSDNGNRDLQQPAQIHHCMASQFITFGEKVVEMQEKTHVKS